MSITSLVVYQATPITGVELVPMKITHGTASMILHQYVELSGTDAAEINMEELRIWYYERGWEWRTV